MRAKLNAAVTLLVLIGLPLGSYLYLKKGFQYRKDALDEMEVTSSVVLDSLRLYKAQSEEPLEHETMLIYADVDDANQNEIIEHFNNLHRQYGERSEVRFGLSHADIRGDEIFKNVDNKLIYDLYHSPVKNEVFADQSKIYLLDKDGGVRGAYAYQDDDAMQKLVKHISVLLPLEKKKKIDLVRKKETNNG